MVTLTRRKPWLLALALLALVVVATLTTQMILRSAEGRDLTFWQALLVAETFSTTGYGELLPFTSPIAILWAILLMVIGIAVIFVGLATVASNWLNARFQPHPPRRAPRGLTGHVIICGAGPVGRFLAEEFAQAEIPCILLSPDRPTLQQAMESGLPALEGDPITSAGLQSAVLGEARALICTLGDPENASICLTARALRTDLPIYSTVEHSKNEPFLLAGQLDRIWQQVEGLYFCQIAILPGSGLDHATLQAARVRERTGATILGLWSHGHFHPAVGATTPLRPGAVLIAAGRPDPSWTGCGPWARPRPGPSRSRTRRS